MKQFAPIQLEVILARYGYTPDDLMDDNKPRVFVENEAMLKDAFEDTWETMKEGVDFVYPLPPFRQKNADSVYPDSLFVDETKLKLKKAKKK